jgi:hypothetical protein
MACIMASLLRTPFFDDIPPGFDQPVIIEITVMTLLDSSYPNQNRPIDKHRSFNVIARVDRVLRGSIDTETVTIIAPTSSCDFALVVGNAGIVMGTPHRRGDGIVELRVVSQSAEEAFRRRALRGQR